MHRFFIDEESFAGEVVRVTGSDFNHISRSLRLNEGDQILVTKGDGWDYLLELIEFHPDQVVGKVLKKRENQTEPPIRITLAQAIPKKNNMDLIVQKCTEIGIAKIIPLMTDRTIVRIKADKEDKKINRWQKVAEEAAKQSQRGIIPEIDRVHSLREIKSIMEDYELAILAWTGEKEQNLKQIISNINNKKTDNILLIIGPEGGFAKNEVEYICQNGGIPVSLGPRILRTETAGLVLLTMILYECGDLGGSING